MDFQNSSFDAYRKKVQKLVSKAKELSEKEEYQQALKYYEEAKILLDKGI